MVTVAIAEPGFCTTSAGISGKTKPKDLHSALYLL